MGKNANNLHKNKGPLKLVKMDFLRQAFTVTRLDHIQYDIVRQRVHVEDTITDQTELTIDMVWLRYDNRVGKMAKKNDILHSQSTQKR